jgi:prostaglandin-endoperoxide synthase 2
LLCSIRAATLRPFNDYRGSYGLRRTTSFAERTADPALRERLEQLHDDDVDKLEWYVGIFAGATPSTRGQPGFSPT